MSRILGITTVNMLTRIDCQRRSSHLGITTVNMFFTQGDILWVAGDRKWMLSTPT